MLAAAAVVALAAGTAALLRGPTAHAPEAPIARRDVTPSTLLSAVTAHQSEALHATTRAVRPPSRWVAQRPSPEIAIADEPEAEGAQTDPVDRIEAAPLRLAPMPAEALTIAPLRMDPMEIVPLAEPRSE